jgi:hypothetical chaperone protein
MIADFGGGTSDFCLVPVGPSQRGTKRKRRDILGTDGVAIAGDAFDARIIRNLVAPRLGRGSHHRTMFDDLMPVPSWLYRDLERWHHLSFLRSPRTLGVLHDILRHSLDKPKIEALLHLIENDLGYALYRAVERTKTALSRETESVLRFDDPPTCIEERVTRADFEDWIREELDDIRSCVDRLLVQTGTATERVDRVFMTGGSSFVPAVRDIFRERFGEAKIRSGGELISVASGLALRARDSR